MITEYMFLDAGNFTAYPIQIPRAALAPTGSKAREQLNLGSIGDVRLFSDAELINFGICRVTRTTDTPALGFVRTGTELQRNAETNEIILTNGVLATEILLTRAFTPEEESTAILEAKNIKKMEIDSQFTIELGETYTHDFGGNVGARDFQIRNEKDYSNINHISTRAQAAIDDGEGATFISRFRMADNSVISVTANEFVVAAKAVHDNWIIFRQVAWDKKDEVEALTTLQEVDAYDVTTGWPV